MTDFTWMVVVGPTATGKSRLAVALAQVLGGEIVNADASQLYRGMDIGTAKTPVEERAGVPHHLLDVLDVTEEANVAVYQRQARLVGEDIARRGGVPILVGGSGLYVRSVLDRIEFPPTDPAVRKRWERRAEREGADVLYAELSDRDPAAAQSIDVRNVRRVVRALEVIELTGAPYSATMPRREYVRPACQVGLRLPRPVLHERIGRRVEQMLSDGLVGETERLVERGLRDGKTAPRALGYAQVLAHLPGEVPCAEVAEETSVATRRYARQQVTWFGADERVQWVDAESDLAEQVNRAVAAFRVGVESSAS